MTINSLKRKTSIGNRFRYGKDFGIIRLGIKITVINNAKGSNGKNEQLVRTDG